MEVIHVATQRTDTSDVMMLVLMILVLFKMQVTNVCQCHNTLVVTMLVLLA